MKYQVFTSTEWVFPDTVIDCDGTKQIAISVSRGSYACSQVILEDIPEGKLSLEYITDNGDPNFMKSPEIYRLVPVYVEKNTGPNGFTVSEGESAEGYTTRPAPFWVYDAMKPIDNSNEHFSGSDHKAGLYLSWPIPRGADPGIYTGRLILMIGNEKCEIPVQVDVFGAVVPEKETLGIINWFSLKNMAIYHNLELWSEEHWDMIRKYGLLMRRGRQTHFWINKEILEVRENSDGTYSFSFEKAERLIRMYFELGFTYIEGGMAVERLNYGDSEFVIRINDGWVKALSKEGYQYLHDYFTAWRTFLEKNGWLDKLVQHVADEPHSACAADYRILAGIVRKLMPGVPLIDAVEMYGLDGSLDIWVPKNHYYEKNRSEFERLGRLGDQLWFYTCCHPGGGYMNRLLDMPLIRTRYLHWGNYIYNIQGYLHWGLNFYDCTDDAFNGRAGQVINLSESSLPPGDTHIVYPGGDRPWGSVRLEAMRAGIEDYELLRIVASGSHEQADRIAKRCVRGFDDFTENVVEFEDTYRELLEAAAM